MTQKRFGKAADIEPSSSRDGGSRNFNWVAALLLIQTLLLAAIFLKTFGLLPSFQGAAVNEELLSRMESEESPPEAAITETSAEDAGEDVTAVKAPVRVEVLNGCGAVGIARRTADFLVRKGYDVRDYKNAEFSNQQHTTIYVRSGDRAQGEALAATIALPLEYVIMKPAPELVDVDITLLLGKDHTRYILPP